MREHGRTDDNPGGVPPHINDRQAQLIAAAEALRTWVSDQRDTWPTAPPFAAAPAVVEPIRREAPEARPAPMFATFTAGAKPYSVEDTDGESAEPSRIAEVAEALRDRVLLLREWLLQWGWRAALGAAIIGVVGTGALKLRQRWANTAVAPKMGTLVLESQPPDSDLFIDGAAAGKTPLKAELRAGRHVVEFRRHNSSRKLNVDVTAGRSTSELLDWTAKRKGSLEVLSDPAGASISVDGVPRGVTPMTIDDLSIGAHTVELESSSGSLTRRVDIRTDRVAQVTEAIYSGWLHVSLPFEMQISEGTRRLQLDDRNQILLSSGAHDLQFENARFGYRERRRVEIKPGAIASIEIAPPPSRLTVNASLPAEVLIDGTRAGETPLAKSIDVGTRVVVVKSITGAERRFTLTVTVNPVSLDVDFAKP